MRWPRGHPAGEDGNIRRESCSCVVRSVAEVEELGLASRKRKLRQKRNGRARMPRSMSFAPLNNRGKRRDRRDTGESARGGKTTAPTQLAHEATARSSWGAAPGLVPGVERKLASTEGALGRGRGRPSRAFVEAALDPSADHRTCSAKRSGEAVTHGESTGASEARLGRPREEENTSSSALLNPSQPALAS